ncbi:Multidrug efflux pump subunit AcrB [Ferrimonas sediminum]|uniref:Multidrug efflux pump subunit AcrB n=1 Tax=Ferrimonas sediminum TaxID=718193 RepID=A0A1G8WW30_9GAMM|nr:efflux RND transporter permease subunit [Ferrimonas sediminum]SDJ82568.1 Multidrug efflux pump subunit AcrB [Ferrimonas sediminum]
MSVLLNWFTGRRLAANLLSVVVVVLGLVALRDLPMAEKPRIDLGHVSVSTFYPGASAEDVEANVTGKLEKELLSVAGIRKFTSRSASGQSSISISLDPEASNPAEVYQDIRDAVNRVSDLPAGVTELPLVRVAKSSNLDFMVVGISADLPYGQLREQARQLELKLRRVPGISEVHLIDLRTPEYWLELQPEQLKRYQLTLTDIADAIGQRNVLMTGGTIQTDDGNLELITSAQMLALSDLSSMVLRSNPEVTLKDVSGAIRQGFERRQSLATINGQTAIGFDLRATEAADVIATSKAVQALLQREQVRLGPDYQLPIGFDIAREIQSRFDIVKYNGLGGLALVLVALSLCLHRKVAPWVAFSIPFCLLGTMTVLSMGGQILDSYTMAALILIIGIIVDDAVVVSERITARRQGGDDVMTAVSGGVKDVFPAITVSILTTMLAFLPLLFLPGNAGKMLYVLPLTISIALLFSFIDALVIIPAHMKSVMTQAPVAEDPWGARFAPVVRWALRYPKRLLALTLLPASGLAWVLYIQLPTLFFPTDGAYLVEISAQLEGNQTLEQSWQRAAAVDRMLAKTGQVVSWYGEVSETEASWTVSLTPASERSIGADAIARQWQQQGAQFAGILSLEFDVDSGGAPSGRPVDLQIVGGNDATRQQVADRVTQWLAQYPGVLAPHQSQADAVAQLKLSVDYPWLSRYGVTLEQLARTVRIAIEGERVSRVFKGNEEVFYRLVLEENDRSPEELNNLYVRGSGSQLVSLDKLVQWQSGQRDEVINHFNGERSIRVSANIDTALTDPIAVEDALMSAMDGVDPAVAIVSSGQARDTREALVGLAIAMAMAVMAIAVLMMVLFDRLGDALVGLLVVPVGVAAALVVLWVHGKPLSFFATVGIIGMTGVVVNNALVLLYHYHGQQFMGDDSRLRRQLLEGACSRVRPMLVTTLTTVAGLLPLAYGLGGYDNLMSPISLVIGWGILLTAPMVLMLVPAGYLLLLRRRARQQPVRSQEGAGAPVI